MAGVPTAPRIKAALQHGHNIPTLAVILIGIADCITLWSHRTRSRRQLKDMPYHRLDDIGVTAAEAQSEAAKPFWLR